MKRIWFISYPSGSFRHTPTFFTAINNFAASQDKIGIAMPHGADDDVKLTRDDIQAAELVIAEASIPSTGSGIELGWANAAGKPIVAFHQAGTVASPSLQFVNATMHTYVTEEDITQKLEELAKQ